MSHFFSTILGTNNLVSADTWTIPCYKLIYKRALILLLISLISIFIYWKVNFVCAILLQISNYMGTKLHVFLTSPGPRVFFFFYCGYVWYVGSVTKFIKSVWTFLIFFLVCFFIFVFVVQCWSIYVASWRMYYYATVDNGRIVMEVHDIRTIEQWRSYIWYDV